MPPLPWLSSESDVVSVTSSPSRLRNASFVLFPHPQFGCSYAASLFLNYENYEFITLSDACCRALLEPLLPDARRLHTVWLRGPSAEVEKAAKKTRVVRAWQEAWACGDGVRGERAGAAAAARGRGGVG